ncbi:NAD(P)(+) transhydrogenase (Re/Si-specific) subunit beta [Inmirania thermothiophila]|uniref:NAD(P) transhydrogenase subunit beta n=1 Tax=Inmirania thermothiophila TaxID=1750597 RepID=A0A3N1XZE1_9GAMM|nr:NAD(P)(+) transhydrogenase (Re/Si-specific) subunit beta [Inmirania thermothiophila]ROR31976.1 NAD(P) transhydrogenase subunit beta [Inmirania thermothiophila]
MHAQDLYALAYLVAGSLFILGIKGLTHPATARRGNLLAMAGMAIGIAATALLPQVRSYGPMLAGVVGGAAIGIPLARRIPMTAMPQLVALLHSFVGLAAVLVAAGTFLTHRATGGTGGVLLTEIYLGAVIGAVTFTGSLVAFGKLHALLPSKPLRFTGQHAINAALAAGALLAGIAFLAAPGLAPLLTGTLLAFALGVLLITPIGGADMPVIVSMLNSYSGWAAAATGFTLGNHLLVITGALVGFSGAILSYIMCRAMNRSLLKVLFGGVGSGGTSAVAQAAERGAKVAAPEDAAFLMANAAKVIIVPGYGMAVAQAQHAVKELTEALGERGVTVKFAIHPVAGRMPGHMNVLLAEAEIPYDQVFEMEAINPEFATADVALVVGANDVVNPAARHDASSPIYGMPVLEAHRARHVFVIKRSLKPGYSGVDNPLFYEENCSLVLGDAKEVCERIAQDVRAL